jgi:Fe-S-cluster containining protein
MKPVEDTTAAAGPAMTAREVLVSRVYAAVDEAAGREIARLKGEEGIVPSCKRGCSGCCCGQHIQTNVLEAHALGQFIRSTFSTRQIEALRRRTRRWHVVDEVRRGRPGSAAAGEEYPSGGAPCCPMLVDQACSAYPVRPLICRTHYVSSDPAMCRAANGQPPADAAPVVLTSVIEAARPFANAFKLGIESTGRDYSRSIMLLPHWLAVEMGWSFDSAEEDDSLGHHF